MRAFILAITVMLCSAPIEAHAPYSKDVREARAWLRERTTDRAFRCAHVLWDRESHWNVRAGETWGAYGIPQAYPGKKMAKFGPDWRRKALTQVKWGRYYVKVRYGSRTRPGFCRALRFQSAHRYY